MDTKFSIYRKLLLKASILTACALAPAYNGQAQMPDILNNNIPPAQSPVLTISGNGINVAKPMPGAVSKVEIGTSNGKPADPNAGSAGKGLDTIRTASDPTAIYRIGIDDLLAVQITNVAAPPKFVKVKTDGTIDFPLAGDPLVVAGKTPREAASLIAGSIKLIKDPRVTLKIREYASHMITVCGLVDQPGEQQIQRDAVPFFVVRAGTNIDARARIVRIVRSSSTKTEEYTLSDPKLGSLLIFPGDSVEFAEPSN